MGESTGEVKKTVKIDREFAEQEFDRWVEDMGLDLDPEGMDDEDKAGLKLNKDKMVRALQRGSLVVNENGEMEFTPQVDSNVGALTFHMMTGASLMAMDRKKSTHDFARLFGVMADMTKSNAAVFANMASPDLQICTAIVTLFLG